MHLDIPSRVSTTSDPAALEARGVELYSAQSERLRDLVGKRTADALCPREDRRFADQIGDQHARGAESPHVAKGRLTRDSRRRSSLIRQKYHSQLFEAIR